MGTRQETGLLPHISHLGVGQAEQLRRLFASSDNPAERIDLAPTLNPAIHTRLAGAYRSEKQRRQTLLYLDADLARRELELF